MLLDSVRIGASGVATIAAGGSSFLVRITQLEELGLAASTLIPGAELDETAADLLALGAEAYEAEKRALGLIARAEQSSFMLRAKLELRGFAKSAVRIALARLETEGILDDRRFARAYAASRLSRRIEGPASLAAALRARGLDAEIVREAVAEALGPEERRGALEKAAAKELKRSGGDKDAARHRLRGLGFTSTEISELFEAEE